MRLGDYFVSDFELEHRNRGVLPTLEYLVKKTLALTVLVAAGGPTLWACDLCAVYSAHESRGLLGEGFFGSVAEQFTHFATMQQDGQKVPNEAQQHLNSAITQLLVGYNVIDRFGVQFNLPVIHRSYVRPDGFDRERGTVSGLGDAALLGRYYAFRINDKNLTLSWNILGGVKFPTGDSQRLQEEVDELTEPPPPPGAPESGIHGHDLALGSGSVDGVVGTSFIARYQRVFLSAAAQYAIRTKGDFDYRYANDLTWSGGPGIYLILENEWTLAAQLNVSGEYKPRDTFQGATAVDTGITVVYLGPEVSVSWRENLSAEVGVDFPVSIRNTALQLVPDYRARAAVTWHF